MKLGVGVRSVKAASMVGISVLLVGVAAASCGSSSRPAAGAPAEAGRAAGATPGSLRLTAPNSLPGDYRAKDPTDIRANDPASAQQQPAGYKSFDGALVARYTTDSGKTLTIGGAWGTISDPGAVVASAITAMQSPRGTWTVPLAEVDAQDPYDPQGRLTCGVQTEALLVMPVCIWADHNTAGSVSFPPWIQGSPATLEQADAADRTRHIRNAMTTAKQ